MRFTARASRGFSLIEAMISSVVLGIGLLGLTQLHFSSINGTLRSEEVSRGSEIARQLADTFATLDWNNMPNACGLSRDLPPAWVNPPQPVGCKFGTGPSTAFNNPSPINACTTWYREDGVPNPTNGAWVARRPRD